MEISTITPTFAGSHVSSVAARREEWLSGGGRGRGGTGRTVGYGVGGKQVMQDDGVGGQGAVEEDVNCGRASEKVMVLGARRVWGTMSMCTTGTVQGVIERICGLSSVRVKRKSRVSPSGKQQRWFDEESTLSALEDKWTSVETQTSWKLESCFQPVTSQYSVQTNAAVVSGDASTCVLSNEVSTVVTTCTGRAATPTDSTVLPQTTTDTQPIFQSDSSTTALPF